VKFRIGSRVNHKHRQRRGVIKEFLSLSVEPWGDDDLAPGAGVKWDDDSKHGWTVVLLEDLEVINDLPI